MYFKQRLVFIRFYLIDFAYERHKVENNRNGARGRSTALNFLSQKWENKLNIIAMEMSKFILLSTFREAEKDFLNAEANARDSIATLFELKQTQITKLVQEIVNDAEWMTLLPNRKQFVLNHLFEQTEKNRRACRLEKCSETFFKKVFDKCEMVAAGQ